MSLKSSNNFKEAELGPDFAQDKLKDFKTLINSSTSFTTISMPGVGVSYFLKYLASQDFAHFIHIDLYSLPTLSQHEFYRMLLTDLGDKPGSKTDEQVVLETKAILKKLAEQHSKVVIIFSRFDQLKKDLDENFLSNLQSLTTLALGKIVEIFTSIKPLYELAPEAITGGNLTFYSKHLYFKPYAKEDLKKLLQLEPEPPTSPAQLDQLIELSGGHNQLLHILLNSHKQQNLLLDKFVKLQLKELIDYLDYQQRKQIQKIALGKKIDGIDEYLLGVGYVTKSDLVILSDPASSGAGESKDLSKYQLFSPLLAQYIKTNLPVKLPVKESKLFKILRNNMGRTTSKDEIFEAVWGEDTENATDWALDALVYRLRKHPFIQNQGYIIESHKKVGYTMVQT